MFSNKQPITISATAWEHQLERTAKLEEKLANLEKRITALETMLSREDDSNPFYPEAGRDDTITLYTPLEEE